MIVSLKDGLKLFGLSIVMCCAVMVCTMFMNYQLDLISIADQITTDAAQMLYQAQISMGKVICVVTGCTLLATSIVLILFYIKHYIDTHQSILGIYKAMGYNSFSIAQHFWMFGWSILIGCMIGWSLAYVICPIFYQAQNADGLFPQMDVTFHPSLILFFIVLPTLLFICVAMGYGYFKLKAPVLDLLKKRKKIRSRRYRPKKEQKTFLQGLRQSVLWEKKVLVFFITFSAFCFSSMSQMAFSMDELASQMFSVMLMGIGLVLAFTILFLSLSTVVKANQKTIAMMQVFGYTDKDCKRIILDSYRPFAYMGFLLGTGYQYGLLKLVLTLVFANVEGVPEYHFDIVNSFISLGLFWISYEFAIYCFFQKLKKVSFKSIMTE
ncbi:MAG: hypothetical protein NC182_04265 [Prevotella sp.]|nr:hypothetical protein [Prevotella sp.]